MPQAVPLSVGRFRLAARIYLLALVFFILTRLAFTVFSWSEADLHWSDLPYIFGVGLVYDTAFYLYALIPVSLYLWLMPQRWWQGWFNRGLVNLAVFASIYGLGFIAVAEYLFWNEFSARFNFISVDYLVYRREVTDNIAQSYPVPLILAALFFLVIPVYLWLRPSIAKALQSDQLWPRRTAYALANIGLAALVFFGLGQSLRSATDSVYDRELASNGPYQFFAAFRNNELSYHDFYPVNDDRRLSRILRQQIKQDNATWLPGDKNQEYNIARQVANPGPEKRLNVMLVMVESLSADFMGVFGDQKGLTPYLDQLSRESMLFTRMYATGTRTTRGLEAVTLSIPPTPGRSIVKRLGHESNMWSLGNVLKAKGYETRFLYGGRGYFDNMNAFFQGNGYDITDQGSVPEDEIGFSNAWGMADEYLFTQAIKQADYASASGKPFMFHIMTTSNHRPYTYPDNRIDIPSGQGRDGSVKYTDWAIHDFIERSRDKPWFADTLFVIIADHQAGVAGKVDLPVPKYHIPMLVYSPGHISPRQVDRVASQIDVVPTLLGMLNMSYVSNFFGKDVLREKTGSGYALMGNYQKLGYYTPGEITILSPRRGLKRYLNPRSAHPKAVTPSPDDKAVLVTEAYYQGADAVYHQGLNRWRPVPETLPKTPIQARSPAGESGKPGKDARMN